MRTSDLIKATVVCGLAAYLVFEFPVLGQALIIALLSVLWLSYLYSTVIGRRVRKARDSASLPLSAARPALFLALAPGSISLLPPSNAP